jgi:hypothetical protein
LGGVYEVEFTIVHPFDGTLGLVLKGHHSNYPLGPARHADGYRKITPGAKIKGIEEPRRLPVKERQDA